MKQCYFCTNGLKEVDYREVDMLKNFIDAHARIISPRKSAVCSKHQRKLALAIKRARFLALLPFSIA